MKPFDDFSSGFIRFFRSVEVPDIFLLTLKLDRSHEFLSAIIETNAFKSRLIIVLNRAIQKVLTTCSLTKVFPFVVEPVSVNVIDFKFGPRPSHVQNSQTMRHILATPNRYFYSLPKSVPGYPSNFMAFPTMFWDGLLSIKFSRFRVIFKTAAELFRSNVGFRIFMPPLHPSSSTTYRWVVNP